MRYTESQIKAIGRQRWIKRNKGKLLLQFGLCVALLLVMAFFGTKNVWLWIAPFAVVGVGAGMSYYNSQKRFVEKVKANPELLK